MTYDKTIYDYLFAVFEIGGKKVILLRYINIESTKNNVTDVFEISRKNLTLKCYFSIFLVLKGKNRSF